MVFGGHFTLSGYEIVHYSSIYASVFLLIHSQFFSEGFFYSFNVGFTGAEL